MNNAQRIANEFAALLNASVVFATFPAIASFSSAAVSLPRTIVDCTFKPLAGSAHLGVATVRVTVESDAGGAEADGILAATSAHEQRCQLVREKFFGLTPDDTDAAREAVATAINTAGRIEIQANYVAQEANAMERDADRFRSTLAFKVAALVNPVAI